MSEPAISDHALLRWLERKHGIDIEFFRRKLMEEVSPRHVEGTKKTKIDGLLYRFEDGVLVTVIRKGNLPAVSDNILPFVFPSERRRG